MAIWWLAVREIFDDRVNECYTAAAQIHESAGIARDKEQISQADFDDLYDCHEAPQDSQPKSYCRLTSLDELWEWEGCSPAQVEEVRAAWGGWLPESYEAYLSLMGVKGRYVDVGSASHYPYVLDAEEVYRAWLQEPPSKNTWHRKTWWLSIVEAMSAVTLLNFFAKPVAVIACTVTSADATGPAQRRQTI